MLKFYWNGIKGSDGKLQRCSYSNGALFHHPEGTITIYSKEYSHFTKDIQAAFEVENDSDIMTDYFEKDRIRVLPSHPLYQNVLTALYLAQKHNEKRHAKYLARNGVMEGVRA